MQQGLFVFQPYLALCFVSKHVKTHLQIKVLLVLRETWSTSGWSLFSLPITEQMFLFLLSTSPDLQDGAVPMLQACESEPQVVSKTTVVLATGMCVIVVQTLWEK